MSLQPNIAANQLSDGRWDIGRVARPPIEDGNIFRTALGIRTLKVYGPPGRASDFSERIMRRQLAYGGETQHDSRSQHATSCIALGRCGTSLEAARGKRHSCDAARRRWMGSDARLAERRIRHWTSLYALVTGGGMSPANGAFQKGVQYLLFRAASNQHAESALASVTRSGDCNPGWSDDTPYKAGSL